MAKIHIELDTNDALDRDMLLLMATVVSAKEQGDEATITAQEYAVQVTREREAEIRQDPTEAAPKRTRRTKEQIAADNAALNAGSTNDIAGSATDAQNALQDPAASIQTQSSQPSGVTLAQINAKLRAVLEADEGAGNRLIELCKTATEGTAISAKLADPKYYPAIWAAIEGL